ncbi:MAG TPA: hypothetical protein PKO41_03600 [Dokdonella sp.]|uniref:hypothetical protein n=1 Tax=Dokdonella sp. TaxID=2291710 RepID=UPI0025C0CB19|nr:hypothetical protein [Dokdonella sp.]MBX3692742.1 hypothetical protein [Dokdonella sp.]MCW5568233.1 hypothetical protein [Dokdonella sp.]HNR91492.1 hypothetical protein [Dokdonella sp.]
MRKFMLMLTVVVVSGSVGCASSSNGVVRKDRNEIDSAKIAAVNAWALQRGVKTTWVNPPLKRVAYERAPRND